jgi:hypothetical protein
MFPDNQASTEDTTQPAGGGGNDEANPEEPYDGYDTDPPSHYPASGNGLARTLPPETEDIPWLIEHSFDSISHQVNYLIQPTQVQPTQVNGHHHHTNAT